MVVGCCLDPSLIIKYFDNIFQLSIVGTVLVRIWLHNSCIILYYLAILKIATNNVNFLTQLLGDKVEDQYCALWLHCPFDTILDFMGQIGILLMCNVWHVELKILNKILWKNKWKHIECNQEVIFASIT